MDNPPISSDTQWTIGRLLDWTRSHFYAKGLSEPRLCSELLLAEALGCPKIELYTRFHMTPSDTQRAAFRNMVIAAAEHQPIAYIIGHKEFYSLDFVVGPDVLIPRPETELLVERALAWCEDHPRGHYELLDIGTGSGCIAITLAKRLEAIHATATDISAAAIDIARQNAENHQVADRITFAQADLLDLATDDGLPAGGRFDIIVSNPPYVATRDRNCLPENVRNFEPHIALFSGDDGLDTYRRIAADVRPHLKPGGMLLLEIGDGQADEVETLITHIAQLQASGRYVDLVGTPRALQFTLPE